jgi:hypothetical protein
VGASDAIERRLGCRHGSVIGLTRFLRRISFHFAGTLYSVKLGSGWGSQ